MSHTFGKELTLNVSDDDRVLWEKIVTKENKTKGLRKLQNKELHNLYSPPNIIMTMKSKRTRRAGHIKKSDNSMVTKSTDTEHFDDSGKDMKIILTYIQE
jgi:hypothetical protein